MSGHVDTSGRGDEDYLDGRGWKIHAAAGSGRIRRAWPVSELCELSAVDLRRLIGGKDVSPVELLAACRERIGIVNPKLNAITATCWERAESEAARAGEAVLAGEPLGALHGLPVAIKDTQLTAGLRTTFGSPLFAGHVPEADERMVAAVRRAGAIVIGKTNVPEFGAGANTKNAVYGATGNPFDPERTCGGSSGGSAVALATGMAPLATGSDTGGSLRTPAAMCGIVGFRPSPGLVPIRHSDLGWSPISVHGPIARDVHDAALVLSVIAAHQEDDPLSAPVDAASLARVEEIDLARLRIAFSEDLGFAPVDPDVRRVFRRRVECIRDCFADAEWRDPPLEDADEIFEILRGMSFLAGHGEHYRSQRDRLGDNVAANVEQALEYDFADAVRAHGAHTRLYRRFVGFMRDYDALITPAVAVSPFPWSEPWPAHVEGRPVRTYFHWLALAYGITLTAHPAIAIPCGRDEAGLPFGLQICGRRGGDRKLLAIAAALERRLARTPATARPRPAVDAP